MLHRLFTMWFHMETNDTLPTLSYRPLHIRDGGGGGGGGGGSGGGGGGGSRLTVVSSEVE